MFCMDSQRRGTDRVSKLVKDVQTPWVYRELHNLTLKFIIPVASSFRRRSSIFLIAVDKAAPAAGAGTSAALEKPTLLVLLRAR